MSNNDFEAKCKEIVRDYFNSNTDAPSHKQITTDDVFIVWLSRTLQNNKAIVSTTISDGMLYEITHNGDKHEIYVDVYKKKQNYVAAM